MQSKSLSDDAVPKLDDLLQSAVEKSDVPLVVAAIANRGDVLYSNAVGATVDSIFWIASMTKPVTSVSIMMLKERGLLDLDDRLDKYLLEYADREVIEHFDAETATFTTRSASTPITLRHLLSHTAGFGYDFNNEIVNALCKDGKRSAFELPLLHDPGARWTYSGATALLGDVIERVTGEKFYAFQKSQIFEPLGMDSTDYFLTDEDIARLLPMHIRMAGEIIRLPNEPFKPHLMADGGILGTATDYILFLQMLLNNGKWNGVQILSEVSVRELLTNQLGTLTVETQPGVKPEMSCAFPVGAGNDKFSLGFQLKGTDDHNARAVGSYSWAGLFNTHFWADPQNGIAAVMLTQMLPFYDDRCIRLLCDFEQCVYENLV
jgi:methyl acetate hydrolase